MDDFTPSNAGNSNTEYTGEQRNFPVPKAGSRRARVSLIVDLGTQERADIWKKPDGTVVNEGTEGAAAFEQKPVQQVVVFADLVNDTVDYGGEIGKAHYRLMLNASFAGVVKGINFSKSPPMDAKGKKIEGKEWALHPQNLLTKLAKATGKEEIIESAKINQLLNMPFMADVEVKETDSGKQDKDGNDIVYKNVNYKGASKVAPVATGEQDENGDDIETIPVFNELKTAPACITFSNAKKEDIKWIRQNIIKMIKQANNYAGSNMEKAIQAFEAEKKAANEDGEAEKPAKAPAKKAAAPKKPVAQDIPDDDIPF